MSLSVFTEPAAHTIYRRLCLSYMGEETMTGCDSETVSDQSDLFSYSILTLMTVGLLLLFTKNVICPFLSEPFSQSAK